MSVLEIDVRKRLGAFALDVAFSSPGRVTALFGASGAGKTTLVNIIAGLVDPDEGHVTIDGTSLFDSGSRVAVAAHRRRIGYVFQDGRLFPHLDVRHNLAFGRWMNGLRRDAAEEVRVIDLLGIGHLLTRRIGGLSGGERSRVAIGRALLLKPRLLLLDEPLASLDEERKGDILPYLERLRDETRTPMIYVSHAADEVRRLATHVVRLERGRVVAQGGIEVLAPGAASLPATTPDDADRVRR